MIRSIADVIEWMPILMYHRIAETEPADDIDCLVTSVARLERHLTWLRSHGYVGVPLDLALHPRQQGEGRRFAVTFDDGYLDTLELALPVLEAHSIPATIFVVADALGGEDAWNARPAPLLSEDQVRAIHRAGYFIGSHGSKHRPLADLTDAALWGEVAGSKARLEDLLETRVRFFSYPHHRLDERVMAAVAKAGYTGAVGGRQLPHQRLNLHRIGGWRLDERRLQWHVTGLHRWVRRQQLPATLRRALKRVGTSA